jgi:hypothetical protein
VMNAGNIFQRSHGIGKNRTVINLDDFVKRFIYPRQTTAG